MTKNIVITGGASGIGKAIAQRFVANGDAVTVLDVEKPDFDVSFLQVDVRDEKQISEAIQKFTSVDVLINSAGVYQLSPITEMSSEDLDTVIDINLKGTFLVSKHALPLLEQNNGVLINIASSIGIVPEAESPAYCASKAGVIMLTKCLALSYAGKVRVNTVLPGPIDTPMLRASFPTEEALKEYATTIPMNKIGTAEDVASVVEFLVSDKAAFVTGAMYTVDGGESISR